MKDTNKAQTLQLVKRAMAGQIENKRVGWWIEENVLHNSPIGSADPVSVLGQIIPSNSGQSFRRIGDKITPKFLRVTGTVSLYSDSANVDTKPIYVRIVVATQKTIKSGFQVNSGSVATGYLLDPAVDGVPNGAFNGNTVDLHFPVNKDLFRVYMDEIVKLTPTKGGIEQQGGYCAQWSYTFSSMPKTLSFDGVPSTINYPNNFAPFVCLGYAYPDGTSPDILTTKVVSNTYSELVFEDA